MNDIEILEEILNRQIEDTEGTKIMKQAIENLINRVKELEEIEEEHRKENGKLREKIKELESMISHRIKYTSELEADLFENSTNYVVSKKQYEHTKKTLKGQIAKKDNEIKEIIEENKALKEQIHYLEATNNKDILKHWRKK